MTENIHQQPSLITVGWGVYFCRKRKQGEHSSAFAVLFGRSRITSHQSRITPCDLSPCTNLGPSSSCTETEQRLMMALLFSLSIDARRCGRGAPLPRPGH